MHGRTTHHALATGALAAALSACGALLGVEPIQIDEGLTPDGAAPAAEAASSPPDARTPAPSCDGAPGPCPPAGGDAASCTAGADCFETEAGDTFGFQDRAPVGACRPGKRSCNADGTPGPCIGAVPPAAEGCDAVDRNCDGVPGIDELAPPPPPGTMSCAKLFRCPAPGRGAIHYRMAIGWTNADGPGIVWTGYAPRGDFSSVTFPPGTLRIARDGDNGTRIGPVNADTACCPGGCPTAQVFFDGAGQYYTPDPRL
jgi:hypothetical protein